MLVVPVTPFGPTPEHRGYGGYIDLRQETFEHVVEVVAQIAAEDLQLPATDA